MFSRKLVEGLQSLSAAELRRFGQFVRSPYFNRNPRVVTLLELLLRHAPNYEDSALSREKIFAAMYSQEAPYQEQQVYDHISFLMRLFESFLTYERYAADNSTQARHLLQGLTTHRLFEHGRRLQRRLAKNQQEAAIRDEGHYYQAYQLEREENRFYSAQLLRTPDESLGKAIYFLDTYYLAAKLRHSCELINRQQIVNQQADIHFLPEIAQYLAAADAPYHKEPAVELYYCVYQMLTSAQPEPFYSKLILLLREHSGKFSKEEYYELYSYAQNFCSRMISSGHTAYREKIFLLYQELLENGLLVANGVLDHRIYKNIVTVGLGQGAYEWVQQFIVQYRPYLSAEFRESAYNYNLAHTYYEQKHYKQALRQLQLVDTEDVFYQLGAKSLLVFIYYESREDEALESLLSAFRAYLRRNPYISEAHRRNHRNMLRAVQKLLHIRENIMWGNLRQATEQVTQLLRQLEENKQVSYFDWLRQQAQKLLEKQP